jgi:hypothetical protein
LKFTLNLLLLRWKGVTGGMGRRPIVRGRRVRAGAHLRRDER